jgi:hypothetical protein
MNINLSLKSNLLFQGGLIALALWMTASCRTDEVKALQAKWEECLTQRTSSTEALLDSTQTLAQLQGRWRLVASSCGRCLEPGIKAATEKVELAFGANAELVQWTNGKEQTRSPFVLAPSYNPGYFSLSFPQPVDVLAYGVIEFCQETLVFRNSYVDGPDYFFVRER